MKILLDTNIPVHAYIEPLHFTEKPQISLGELYAEKSKYALPLKYYMNSLL